MKLEDYFLQKSVMFMLMPLLKWLIKYNHMQFCHLSLEEYLWGGSLLLEECTACCSCNVTSKSWNQSSKGVAWNSSILMERLKFFWFDLCCRFPHDNPSAKPPTTPDEDIFQFLTESYAQTHPTMMQSENPCQALTPDAPSGIIHGQALGVYKNSLLDYTYENMPDVFMVCYVYILFAISSRGPN